ncbi:hypothetical protein F5878DRAFT_698827 [Lentinula raphanica]|uniref:Uncharacterized protein n=1 Tax=Lentinula raphanica TaxID=153919 RepID=A0AA38U7S5_9AGAR|nr:hypothetical protein F5878DRAFT_698827 [Lentinula raphanica]
MQNGLQALAHMLCIEVTASAAPSSVSVTLLITDKHSDEISCISQEVVVPCIDNIGCKPSEFRVRSQDILNALQQTPAGLEGSGQLLKSDPQHPGFNQILIKSGEFSSAVPSPEFLVIPEARVITLIVEKKRSISVHETEVKSATSDIINAPGPASSSHTHLQDQRLLNLHWSQESDDVTPLDFARKTQSQRKEQRVKHKGERKERMVTWLRSEAEKLPGFENFQSSRCHRLANPDIAIHWAFAAEFSESMFRKKCEVTGLTITKKVIAKVLGLGETSLATAEEGHDLIGIYGSGGSHEAQEVINAIEGMDTNITGASELLDFLREWEFNHPVLGSKAEKRRKRRQQ